MESRSEVCIVSRSTTCRPCAYSLQIFNPSPWYSQFPLGIFPSDTFIYTVTCIQKKLQAEHMRFLGALLGLNRKDEQRNTLIRTKLQVKTVFENITQY